jgi:hypothetical protein
MAWYSDLGGGFRFGVGGGIAEELKGREEGEKEKGEREKKKDWNKKFKLCGGESRPSGFYCWSGIATNNSGTPRI